MFILLCFAIDVHVYLTGTCNDDYHFERQTRTDERHVIRSNCTFVEFAFQTVGHYRLLLRTKFKQNFLGAIDLLARYMVIPWYEKSLIWSIQGQN